MRSDLFSRGAAWLATKLGGAGIDVIWVHGDDRRVLRAVVGATEYEIEDTSGVVQRYQSRDFIVQARDLVDAGQMVAPEAGDKIIELDGKRGEMTYEVMAPTGQAVWTYVDPHRWLVRIHTKEVSN